MQVPVLDYDGLFIRDSSVIVTYLAKEFDVPEAKEIVFRGMKWATR